MSVALLRKANSRFLYSSFLFVQFSLFFQLNKPICYAILNEKHCWRLLMKENILLDKTLDFAASIVLFYEDYSKSRKDTTIAKQLLRSATSIGANLNEAIYGNSKADFISKLHICLKETSESIYWLTLLHKTKLVDDRANDWIANAEEIKRILISSLNTAKGNK